MPHSSSIGLGQLVSSGGTLETVRETDTTASNRDDLDNLAHNLATRKDSGFEVNVL